MKKSIVLMSAVMALAVGVANAEEPMVLTGEQMDNVSAAGGVNFNSYIKRYYNSQQHVNNAHTSHNVNVNLLFGNSADSDAQADAFGSDTLTYTATGAQVVQGQHSQSYSKSVAATSGFWGYCGVCGFD